MTGPLYPGVVHRATLINFCQKQVRQYESDRNILEKAYDRTPDVDFELAISSLNGKILALRQVCEWAKENVILEASS